MPALSPTMEAGSIAKWNLKEGDKFEPGTSLCDVETDKATVSFDAQDEGYVAKILITTGEIKVGQPLLVTVEDQSAVSAFANFTIGNAASAPPSTPTPPAKEQKTQEAVLSPAPVAPAAISAAPVSSAPSGSKIFASPLAKKLIRESNDDLSRIAAVLGPSRGSGPNGRIIAEDVIKAMAAPRQTQSTAAQPPAETAQVQPAQPQSQPQQALPSGVFQDFVVSDSLRALAERFTHAKKTVPHYFLSVELDLTQLLTLRETLNAVGNSKKNKKDDNNDGVGVLELILKAAAGAMKVVPDANALWHDTFVRRYEQVDINLFMSAGGRTVAPVLRDVGDRGLGSLGQQIAALETDLTSEGKEFDEALGTFAVHNLGVYGIRSAAPILLPPQGCALSLGAINEAIVPSGNKEGDNWRVAPVMIATLVCDHRVVDGAVSAQWLAAFKQLVENPATILM